LRREKKTPIPLQLKPTLLLLLLPLPQHTLNRLLRLAPNLLHAPILLQFPLQQFLQILLPDDLGSKEGFEERGTVGRGDGRDGDFEEGGGEGLTETTGGAVAVVEVERDGEGGEGAVVEESLGEDLFSPIDE
jgi:hypothetical protein